MPERPAIVDGALRLDGAPRLLLAGEYPYYRDDPQRWPSKLAAMRRVGLEVVSFYVPWRHHEMPVDGGARFTFDGPGNRDLVGFLACVQASGLLALAKPGPYVHAELPLGGLPDRQSPAVDPRRVAALSAGGVPLRAHGLALPSTRDPAFVADAVAWLRAVGAVLAPFLHPDGPVVAVQVGNEGVYGETGMPIDAHDYSAPFCQAFAAVTGAGPPRRWSGPGRPDGWRPFVAWGEHLAEALASDVATFASALDVDVPKLVNLPPPPPARRCGERAAGRYDAWLARSRPERLAGVAYGHTSWAGNVAVDDAALVDYVLAAKRGRGPCLEENWSLDWVEPTCGDAVVPIYHALLGLACGGTGIDVYTACATDGWGEHLALDPQAVRDAGEDPRMLDRPYGGAAPIDSSGRPGPGFDALAVFLDFLRREGPDLTATRNPPGVVWALYPAYGSLLGWSGEGGAEPPEAPWPLPPPAAATLVPFARHCLRHTIPFELASLERPADVVGRDARLVTAVSGAFMSAGAQEALATLARRGRPVLLFGRLPVLDEHQRPCTVLADLAPDVEVVPFTDGADLCRAVDGRLAALGDDTASGPVPERVVSLERRHSDGDGGYLFLFSRADAARRVRTRIGATPVEVDLPARGVAAVRVRGNLLVACYVKGLDERHETGVPARVRVGGTEIATSKPADLSATGGPGRFGVRTFPENVRVRVSPATGAPAVASG